MIITIINSVNYQSWFLNWCFFYSKYVAYGESCFTITQRNQLFNLYQSKRYTDSKATFTQAGNCCRTALLHQQVSKNLNLAL